MKTIDTKLNESYDGEIKPGDGEIDKPPPTEIWQKLRHFVGEIGSFIIRLEEDYCGRTSGNHSTLNLPEDLVDLTEIFHPKDDDSEGILVVIYRREIEDHTTGISRR